ncbi:cell cycle checkpoint control protein family [Thalictrum thalictroides]|uniref:Cell cycle checkpoint control protein family n=1 Tax=Thalictrum thalictroides TaxID=46969 RepID=A0A7J6VAE2_THATH|nr:cell cycle checkpoint control protein family [Thalictrum thalictroides]
MLNLDFDLKNLALGNRPILMAPKFGLDDGSNSDFDVTLVLATMLVSQLQEGYPMENPTTGAPTDQGRDSQAHHGRSRLLSVHLITPESGSVARSGSGAEERHAHVQESVNAGEESGMQRVTMIGNARAATENVPNDPNK